MVDHLKTYEICPFIYILILEKKTRIKSSDKNDYLFEMIILKKKKETKKNQEQNTNIKSNLKVTFH